MSLAALLLRELRHHWVNAVLTAVGLTVAVALLTVVRLTGTAAQRETTRVMRDLGFNLRIVPQTTDLEFFWANGHSDQTLPESDVTRLAEAAGTFVSFNHLTPSLERRYPVEGREVLLTGLGKTVVGPGQAKTPMGFQIAPGTVYLGHAVATRLGVRRGGTVPLGGRPFTVERVLAEAGTDEDIRVYCALEDAQSLLGLPGRITEIKAIDCLCLTADENPLEQLRAALETALPGARVLQLRTLADARARQRQMAERVAAFAQPAVVGVGAIWVGILAALNVRARFAEIGLWRALGKSSGRIAALVLGRAVLLGVAGAATGFALGTVVGLRFGSRLFPVTAKALAADPSLLGWALLWTPLLAAVAAFLPAALAVAHDPARALRAD